MASSIDLSSAQSFLRSGNFFSAMEAFGYLLENEPENPELAAGYFAAHYWFNRQEGSKLRKPGRELASFLLSEWENFEALAKSRSFAGSEAFLLARDTVLGRAAANYRKSIHEEGATSIGSENLEQLARCLLRLGDDENAVEILEYAGGKLPATASFLFLLAEAQSRLPDPKKRLSGHSFFRDACLMDHRKLPMDMLRSHPAAEVFAGLCEKKGNQEDAIEWFGAYFLNAVFAEPLRELRPAEVRYVGEERVRLKKALHHSPKKFQERIRAMLAFMILVLLQNGGDAKTEALRAELQEIEPGLLEKTKIT